MLSGFGNYFVPLDDRRARHGVPAPQRASATGCSSSPGSSCTRSSSLGRGAGRRLVQLRPAHRSTQFDSGPNIDFYALGLIFLGISHDGRRDQLHRHDLQAARARDVDQPDAAVLLGGARRPRSPIVFALPALTAANVPARAGPPVRHPLLRPGGRRRPAPLAAPLLDLRAPGRLHHLPPGRRDRLDDHARSFARRPIVALHVRGARDGGDRVHQLRRLGAPHVRRRAAAARADLLRGGEH